MAPPHTRACSCIKRLALCVVTEIGEAGSSSLASRRTPHSYQSASVLGELWALKGFGTTLVLLEIIDRALYLYPLVGII